MSCKGLLSGWASDFYAQMKLAREEETEKVELITLLSMSPEELDKGITALQQDIEDMNRTLKKMKAIHKDISEEAKIEEVGWFESFESNFEF